MGFNFLAKVESFFQIVENPLNGYFNTKTSIMKKTICFIILIFSFATYAQDIEEMNKKELKIALKKAVSSKDSLVSVNNNTTSEMSLLAEQFNKVNDSIKTQKAKISLLLLSKNQCDKNNKILTHEVVVLNDSIAKINSGLNQTIQEDVENDDNIPIELECLGVWVGKVGGKTLTFIMSNYDDLGFTGYCVVNNSVKSLKGSKMKDSKIVFKVFEERKVIGTISIRFDFDELNNNHKATGVFKYNDGSSENVTLSIDYNYNN